MSYILIDDSKKYSSPYVNLYNYKNPAYYWDLICNSITFKQYKKHCNARSTNKYSDYFQNVSKITKSKNILKIAELGLSACGERGML